MYFALQIEETISIADVPELLAYIRYGWDMTLFFFFGATAPIWALAYLHETLRFTSVF
jgi:hypothetical protein